MSSIIVQAGQVIEDIAIQYLGSEEGVFALAQLNGLGFTADLTPGQVLELPAVVERRVRKIYVDGGYVPASTEDGSFQGSGLVVSIAAGYQETIGVAVVMGGQQLEDIAIQYLGSEEGVFALAQLNGLGYTDDIQPGQVLQLPAAVSLSTVTEFAKNKWVPASVTGDDAILEGVDYWIIEQDFVVQ